MKVITTAALLLLSISVLAPQASIAGKPDGNSGGKPDRNPPTECAFTELQDPDEWAVQLEIAYDMTGDLKYEFKKAEKNVSPLECKLSGAEIKMMQSKVDEAYYLVLQAIEKIVDLHEGRKLSVDGLDMLSTQYGLARDEIEKILIN